MDEHYYDWGSCPCVLSIRIACSRRNDRQRTNDLYGEWSTSTSHHWFACLPSVLLSNTSIFSSKKWTRWFHILFSCRSLLMALVLAGGHCNLFIGFFLSHSHVSFLGCKPCSHLARTFCGILGFPSCENCTIVRSSLVTHIGTYDSVHHCLGSPDTHVHVCKLLLS